MGLSMMRHLLERNAMEYSTIASVWICSFFFFVSLHVTVALSFILYAYRSRDFFGFSANLKIPAELVDQGSHLYQS